MPHLVDSRSGHDIVDVRHVIADRDKWQKLSHFVHLTTAGGKTGGGHEVAVRVEPIQEDVSALILENTPDLLSLGRRCVENGYAFH